MDTEYESTQKADSRKQNSPTIPAGIQTHNLWFKLTIFQSWVQHSTNWAILTPLDAKIYTLMPYYIHTLVEQASSVEPAYIASPCQCCLPIPTPDH